MNMQVTITVGEARDRGWLTEICDLLNRSDLENQWPDHEFTLNCAECEKLWYLIRDWM